MSRNPCLDIALRELGAAGIRNITQGYGSKHLQLRWRVNGHPERMYSMALTPSDVRAPYNVRSDIRRLLRDDGIIIDAPKSAVAPAPKLSQRLAALEGRVAILERENRELRASVVGQVSSENFSACAT